MTYFHAILLALIFSMKDICPLDLLAYFEPEVITQLLEPSLPFHAASLLTRIPQTHPLQLPPLLFQLSFLKLHSLQLTASPALAWSLQLAQRTHHVSNQICLQAVFTLKQVLLCAFVEVSRQRQDVRTSLF